MHVCMCVCMRMQVFIYVLVVLCVYVCVCVWMRAFCFTFFFRRHRGTIRAHNGPFGADAIQWRPSATRRGAPRSAPPHLAARTTSRRSSVFFSPASTTASGPSVSLLSDVEVSTPPPLRSRATPKVEEPNADHISTHIGDLSSSAQPRKYQDWSGSDPLEYQAPFPEHNHDPADVNKLMSTIRQEIDNKAAEVKVAEEAEEADKYDFSGLDGKQKKLAEVFKAALDSNDIGVASALGQRFKRELKSSPADAEEYASCKTDKDRLNFRLAWAGRRLREIHVIKESVKEYQKVDEKLGSYFTLERIAVEFGHAADHARALEAARRHCTRCVCMSGRWTMWDPMAGQWLFLLLTHNSREVFSKCWRMYEQEKDNVDTKQTSVQAPLSLPRDRWPMLHHEAGIPTCAEEGLAPEKTLVRTPNKSPPYK